MSGGEVPDLGPGGARGGGAEEACPGRVIVDAIERRQQEARNAEWAGVLVAVLGVLTWNPWGFLACGICALAFGLYARRFAPMESWGALAAGGMLLVVYGLSLADVV